MPYGIFKLFDAAALARSLGVFVILYAAYSLWRLRAGPGVTRGLPLLVK